MSDEECMSFQHGVVECALFDVILAAISNYVADDDRDQPRML